MTTIKLRRGTAAEWTSGNPILAEGEVGFEKDTNKYKIGNGTSAWTALKYFLAEDLLNTTFAHQWQASTAYVANDLVLAPDGGIIQRNANGTSRSAYDVTEQAAWTVKSNGAGMSVATAIPALTAPPAKSLVTKGFYARTAPAPSGNASGLRIMAKDPNYNGSASTGRIWGVGLGTSTLILSDDDGATFVTKSGVFTDPVQGSDSIQGIYFSTNFVWVLTTYNLWRFAKPSANGNPGGIGTDALANSWNTTIASASNGQTLPQATINIANGNYFATGGGVASVETSAGPQLVTYTGKTAGTLTGCSGGTGTMSTGARVRNGYRVFGLSDLVNGPGGAPGAGGVNASFRNACFAIAADESNAYVCEYGTLNASVTKTPLTDGHINKNSTRLISDVGPFTADMVGKTVNISGATSGGTTLVTTITEIINESSPGVVEISSAAGTTVDNATISWPAQTYGSGVVIGGPSVYACANPTAAPGSVVWTKKKTFTQGKHCHAVKVIGGVPWVTIGDMSVQFTHCGIWTASALGASSWNQRSARPRGEVAKDPINIYPVTVSGSAVVIGESDSSFRDGPLMFADQTGQVVRMIESTFRLPQPYSQTMRQLTIDPLTGNIYWFGTGESGGVGPTSAIWMSRAPYTVPVLLEDVGTALDGETVPDGVINNGYFWIGHYRCVLEKFADQT